MVRSLVPWDVRSPSLFSWDVSAPRLFDDLRQEMNRLMERFAGWEDGGERSVFAPRVNLAESETAYEISLDLPGMKPDDFTVELKDNHLWVSGERKCHAEEKGKTFHRTECCYGKFQRVIPLEASVDSDKVQAEYKDGVLQITVPKSETVRPRRIPINAESAK